MIRSEQVRKAKGLSQNALAQQIQMHPSTISAIENGRAKPWPGQAKRIAEALDWPADRAEELFEEVDGS